MIQFEQIISADLMRKQGERELKARDYVYASEIGGSLLDTYLSMMGVEPTNPPDERALRTMNMGHIFEDYVSSLFPAELKVEKEVSVEYTENGDLYVPVHGRIDFLINDEIVELKTVHSQSFWRSTKAHGNFVAYPHHILQLYTYAKARGTNTGHLVYVSKDDMSIEQLTYTFQPGDEIDKQWQDWMGAITTAIRTKTEPKMEDKIVMENGKWKANWHITRSRYFTKLTGLTDPKEIENEARRLQYKLDKETKANAF